MEIAPLIALQFLPAAFRNVVHSAVFDTHTHTLRSGYYCVCSLPDWVEEMRLLPAVYDTALRNGNSVDNTLNLSITRHLAVSLTGVDTSFSRKMIQY